MSMMVMWDVRIGNLSVPGALFYGPVGGSFFSARYSTSSRWVNDDRPRLPPT